MTRTALVTGAAAGIGRACALRLAHEGMAIGVLDVNLAGCQQVAAEIQAAGGKAIALGASIADRGQVNVTVAKLHEAFGPITVLVNNAGVCEFVPFLDVSDEQLDLMLEVNVKGTFIVTQVVLPDMVAAKWGRIINISSSSAQTGAIGRTHYSASKGAVISLTRSLAQEVGPLGVTVNNIPPGTVTDTLMSIASREAMPERMAADAKGIPVQRTGRSEDIADACAWLASEGASYVTGQTIGVNGGRVVS